MRLAPLVIEIMINAAAAVESVGAAAEGEISCGCGKPGKTLLPCETGATVASGTDSWLNVGYPLVI